jgi:hypothetical protein
MHYAISAVKWDERKSKIIAVKLHEVVPGKDEEGFQYIILSNPYEANVNDVVQKCWAGTVHVVIFDGADNPILTDKVQPEGQHEALVSINSDGYKTDSLHSLPAFHSLSR